MVGLKAPRAGLARSSPALYQVCIGAFPNVDANKHGRPRSFRSFAFTPC